MSEKDGLEQKAPRPARHAVGDRVRIIYGREAGESGKIVMMLQRGRELQYVVEYGNDRRAYCSEGEIRSDQ